MNNLKGAKGNIIAVAAPSGTGKTTLVKEILKEFPEIIFSVSATTRSKRPNEVDGLDYFFLTEEEFKKKIDNDEFAEWECFYDYYYGTFKNFINHAVEQGNTIILEVDVKGALSIKKNYPSANLVFIEPPSFEILEERLKNRKTESDEDLQKRIKRAKMELSMKDKFDYFILNKDLSVAIKELKLLVKKIITKENT